MLAFIRGKSSRALLLTVVCALSASRGGLQTASQRSTPAAPVASVEAAPVILRPVLRLRRVQWPRLGDGLRGYFGLGVTGYVDRIAFHEGQMVRKATFCS